VSRDLEDRLEALGAAVALADGRLDGRRVAAARAVVERAGERLGLDLEATVVALAGPTGAGKSTLFNALAAAELAGTGVRRPTTSSASAAVWGSVDGALLDWLDVPRRHAVGADATPGLVLLDLPDFDSVQVSHRLEVERLVALVDLMVWVVDPQKYADAALHDGLLRPLAAHAGVMVVVLNQADLLAPAALDAAARDLARVLRADGLDGVPVLPVSARTGAGLEALRAMLAERVRRREAALARLSADVATAAVGLDAGCAAGAAGRAGRDERRRLAGALGEAAGVPAVVRGVAQAHARRGTLAAGWPFTRWLRRLAPDPLRRLGLGADRTPDARTSLPAPSGAQRGQVSSAARTLAADAAGTLPDPWPGLVRRAATSQEDALPEALDRAVGAADLRLTSPRWWALARALQALLAVVVVIGVVWLLVLAGVGWLRLGDVVPTPDVRGVPVPTGLLLGGVLCGLALTLLVRLLNRAGARRRARAAERALRANVDDVAQRLVIAPVEAELHAREELCSALANAAGERRRRGPRQARGRVPQRTK
jgi:GTP-binding protein EngB required for normal cell division